MGHKCSGKKREERCSWTWASWKEADAKGEECHEYEWVDAVLLLSGLHGP